VALKDEIWGCFKYIGIPMNEIMNMPVYDRKYYILKHNMEQDELQKELEGGSGESYTVQGQAINEYAKIAQNDPIKK